MKHNSDLNQSKKSLPRAVKVGLLLAVVIPLGYWGIANVRDQVSSSSDLNSEVVLSEVVTLDQEFTFKGRSAEGSLSDVDLKLKFLGVQKQFEVLIKGQRAQARNEKAFLIFEIGLVNDSGQVVYLDPVDLVRWQESDGTKIAPQVTQGNLEVRPQSTKKSNLGFVVGKEASNFSIQVGELDGEKKVFEVDFD